MSAPSDDQRRITHSNGWRRHQMKMLALTSPIAWIAKLKSRPSAAGWWKRSTSTGNPMAPPRKGVEPAT